MSLSFLSWNLAMMARSAQAPQHWEMFHTEAYVAETIKEVAPDVVLFQELPGLVPFVETHAMVGANPKTHSGNLAVLVKHELVEENQRWATVGSFASTIVLGDITIANVHLAPGRGDHQTRLDQLAQIADSSETEALLIVGDTNTRVVEEPAIEALGLEGERPPRPTWNSKLNRFNRSGAEFSAYFTRWFSSGPIAVTDAWVGDKRYVEEASKRFYVSDHFACGASVARADALGG